MPASSPSCAPCCADDSGFISEIDLEACLVHPPARVGLPATATARSRAIKHASFTRGIIRASDG
jgi:hypothetical protein